MSTLNQNNVQLKKEPSESTMNLPEGWAECQLSDVIYVQNGYAFPSEDYRDTGVPLVRQTNLGGDKLLLDKRVFLARRVNWKACRSQLFGEDCLAHVSFSYSFNLC